MFESLFEAIDIGRMRVKNRLVVPPMGTSLADENGLVTERILDYYEERAKGGFGLVTVEVTGVSPFGKAVENQLALWDDKYIEGFSRLADRIHKHGGKMSVQIHHAGRQTQPEAIGGRQPEAPSSLACPTLQVPTREMTNEEVYQSIDDFVAAAVRVKKAGGDAVEIHGAHGYLIAQFMSSHSNKRVDEFGGSLNNRMRFPRLIIEGVRRELGNDFPIIFRISAEEKMLGSRNLPETRAVVKHMEDLGVDAIHLGGGTYGSIQWIWGPSDWPLAYMADLAEELKRTVDIPVIAVGRINDPYVAEELVESGRADMISIGRQSIADPHFPNKILTGSLDEIWPCTGCHLGCSGELFAGRTVTCAVNPFAGWEKDSELEMAEFKKDVMVIGGGPAGLLSAAILAERGHDVSLYEKEEDLGGQYRIAAYPPGKSDLTKPIVFYTSKCEKAGVDIYRGLEVDEDLIKEEAPDSIVIATGGRPLLLEIEGVDGESLVLANDVLLGKKTVGQDVLIAGGGLIGAETADFLNEYSRDVTIVEMEDTIGSDMNNIVRIGLMDRLEEASTEFITGAEILKFLDGGLVLEMEGERIEISGYDSIVLAMGVEAYNPLEELARKYCDDVHIIGDARLPARILDASKDAKRVGMKI